MLDELRPQSNRDDQADYDYVGLRGIWLRRIGDQVHVLAEGDDGWHLVIEERADGSYSHIVEPAGVLSAPLDPLDEASRA